MIDNHKVSPYNDDGEYHCIIITDQIIHLITNSELYCHNIVLQYLKPEYRWRIHYSSWPGGCSPVSPITSRNIMLSLKRLISFVSGTFAAGLSNSVLRPMSGGTIWWWSMSFSSFSSSWMLSIKSISSFITVNSTRTSSSEKLFKCWEYSDLLSHRNQCALVLLQNSPDCYRTSDFPELRAVRLPH